MGTEFIRIDKDNLHKRAVSIRAMSSEHWRALRKLAFLKEQSIADYLAELIEEKLDESKRNQ